MKTVRQSNKKYNKFIINLMLAALNFCLLNSILQICKNWIIDNRYRLFARSGCWCYLQYLILPTIMMIIADLVDQLFKKPRNLEKHWKLSDWKKVNRGIMYFKKNFRKRALPDRNQHAQNSALSKRKSETTSKNRRTKE